MNKELEIELMKMFIKNNLRELNEMNEKMTLLWDETEKFQKRLDYLEGKE